MRALKKRAATEKAGAGEAASPAQSRRAFEIVVHSPSPHLILSLTGCKATQLRLIGHLHHG